MGPNVHQMQPMQQMNTGMDIQHDFSPNYGAGMPGPNMNALNQMSHLSNISGSNAAQIFMNMQSNMGGGGS